MIFSKSFGYSIRAILYLALTNKGNHWVALDEIASDLSIPPHFLSKVMKRLAKEGILGSKRGITGGFSINDNTLETPLAKLMEITGDARHFRSCVLNFKQCNAKKPCPLHSEAELLKKGWHTLLNKTRVGDLLNNRPDFISTISGE